MSILENIMSNIYNNQPGLKETSQKPDDEARAARLKNMTEAERTEMLTELKADGKSYVRGTVTDLRQNMVQLRLDSGEVINARTESPLPLSIGTKANFYVTANDGKLLTLKLAKDSLPDGDSQKMQLLTSALRSANLNITERTLSIASELMDHSQAVNAANIRKFMVLTSKFPDTPVRDLVLMDTNNIPATQENVEMMKTFGEGAAKVLPELQKAMDEINTMLSDVKDPIVREALTNEFNEIINSEVTGKEQAESQLQGASGEAGELQNAAGSLAPEMQDPSKGSFADPKVSGNTVSAEARDISNPQTSESAVTGKALSEANIATRANTINPENSDAGVKTAPNSLAGEAENSAKIPVAGSENDINSSAVEQKNAGNVQPQGSQGEASSPVATQNAETNPAVPVQGNAKTPSEALQNTQAQNNNMLQSLASDDASGSAHPGMRHITEGLRPSDISDPEIVKQFYKKLKGVSEKLEKLSDKIREEIERTAAESAVRQAESAAGGKSVHTNNLNRSLKFMDTINNIFPYIQLPIKLKEENAHGELYVYEKKRALKDAENLSALLHLELDALGTTDIYVKLNGKNVYTSFSVTDKAAEKIFTDELPALEAALQKKGYSLSSDVKQRDDKEKKENSPLLTEFLEAHSPSSVSRYSFDMRA